jgi:hypothetical protein
MPVNNLLSYEGAPQRPAGDVQELDLHENVIRGTGWRRQVLAGRGNVPSLRPFRRHSWQTSEVGFFHRPSG